MPSGMIDLPPYLVVKRRARRPDAHYFQVPARLRPEGWPATIRLSDDLATACVEARKHHERLKAERATAAPPRDDTGTLPWLIRSFERSDAYKALRPRSQQAYQYPARIVVEWSAKANHPPVAKITRPAILKFLSALEDTPSTRLAVASYLRTLLTHAQDLGLIETNPASRLRLKRPKAKVRIWSREEFDAVVTWLDAHGRQQLVTALWIALTIGQREGDVLRLQEPRDYRNGVFRFWQSKTGAYVTVPAPDRLRQRIAARPRGQIPLVANEVTGVGYNLRTLNKWLRKATRDLGLDDLRFMHLRHTAVVEMARAGCEVPEIASITGHSLRGVTKILEHYLPRDSEVARNAIAKLDAYREQKLDASVGCELDVSAKSLK